MRNNVNFGIALELEEGDLRGKITRVIQGGVDFILARRSESYPFIDTKMDVVSGSNFPVSDALRGPGTIFTWIQGRGLEALSAHLRWAREGEVPAEILARWNQEIPALLGVTIKSMEAARAKNGGRLPFMMSRQGQALSVDSAGHVIAASSGLSPATSLSDLFYAKGLVAAANVMNDPAMVRQAENIFFDVVEDLRGGKFCFGQIALDPKNPVENVPGRFSHAGRMICIGAATVFFKVTREERYRALGQEFTCHILAHHVAKPGGRNSGDFWEFVDRGGRPWQTDGGQSWSDPGHATEFVGLALAHMRATGINDPDLIDRLVRVLRKNFSNGFTGRGIVKSFDLAARHAINPDMPWWSLPETMRAAAMAGLMADIQEHADLTVVFRDCWRAFEKHFLRPERWHLSIQCLQADGSVSSAIPATPDLDPAYHTGLSLIDCLQVFHDRG